MCQMAGHMAQNIEVGKKRSEDKYKVGKILGMNSFVMLFIREIQRLIRYIYEEKNNKYQKTSFF